MPNQSSFFDGDNSNFYQCDSANPEPIPMPSYLKVNLASLPMQPYPAVEDPDEFLVPLPPANKHLFLGGHDPRAYHSNPAINPCPLPIPFQLPNAPSFFGPLPFLTPHWIPTPE